MKTVRPIITSNEVLFLQITLVGSNNTSGREKEGKRDTTRRLNKKERMR
jgi:hypothetical protein